MPLPDASVKWDDAALIVLRRIYRAKDPTATDDVPMRIFDHVRVASSVSGLDPLGSADVRLWMRHWREVGIIPGDGHYSEL